MSDNPEQPERYRLGDLQLDAGRRTVSRDGRRIRLPGLSFDLLLTLARHAPDVVSTDRFMDEVWSGRVVNTETVAKRVEMVRHALGDDSHEPRYIGLVRGHGYQLLAPIEAVAANALPPPRSRLVYLLAAGLAAISMLLGAQVLWHDAARAMAPSVVVLPFINLSADEEQEYFADGLSEEILNLLAGIADLKVTARTSSFAVSGKDLPVSKIADTLGVNHVLEGSVRKSGERLRVTARLIRAEDGFQLWSESYDRRLEDVFRIQEEIAGAIAHALQLKLAGPGGRSPAPRGTSSLPAYDLYLQARRLIQGRSISGLNAARALLDEVLALNPDYAPALAAAGEVRLLLSSDAATYGDIPLDEAAEEAGALLDRALALEPDLAEAHAIQGLRLNLLRDHERAEASLDRALELNPSLSDARHWLAINLDLRRRLHASILARRRLAEIDPLHQLNLAHLSALLRDSGAPEEAEAVALRVQRGFPDSYLGFLRRAEVLRDAGRLADALPPAQRTLELAGSQSRVQESIGRLFFALGDYERLLALPMADGYGLALLALGRTDEGIAEMQRRAADSRGNAFAVLELAMTLSLAGRHADVLRLYREHWGSLAAQEAAFGYEKLTTELAPLAAAQRATGQSEELAATLKLWGERLAFLREQGYSHPDFIYTTALFQALGGEHEAALATLSTAVDDGYRTPLLAREPAFAELRDDPAFQAQAQRMMDLINPERARLEMPPLP